MKIQETNSRLVKCNTSVNTNSKSKQVVTGSLLGLKGQVSPVFVCVEPT
jgi:hypothetical protein